MVDSVDVIHEECPNENHCDKDSSKCCYLVKNRCMIREMKNEDNIYEFF